MTEEMGETLHSIAKEAKRNKFSLTKKLSEDGELLIKKSDCQLCDFLDIVAIWERASDFIEKQMLQQKVG